MYLKLSIFLCVLVLTALSSESWACQKANDEVTLRAFGGKISIPSNMEVIVREGSEDSYMICILRKMDSEGGLRAVIISRPYHPDKGGQTKLKTIDKYELNDFSIELFKSDGKIWNSSLMMARVSRCNETGLVIIETKESLNLFLTKASPMDCPTHTPEGDR